jgi:hypothetical protein
MKENSASSMTMLAMPCEMASEPSTLLAAHAIGAGLLEQHIGLFGTEMRTNAILELFIALVATASHIKRRELEMVRQTRWRDPSCQGANSNG